MKFNHHKLSHVQKLIKKVKTLLEKGEERQNGYLIGHVFFPTPSPAAVAAKRREIYWDTETLNGSEP